MARYTVGATRHKRFGAEVATESEDGHGNPDAPPPFGTFKRIAAERGSMSAEQVTIEDLGRELGERIAKTPEYRRFEEAREAVQRDEDVQAQIEEFERLREQFMAARGSGQATQSDLHEVQSAQEELHSMPVMSEFLEAQDELDETLEAVNEAISEPLDVDFGGQAGGCCQD